MSLPRSDSPQDTRPAAPVVVIAAKDRVGRLAARHPQATRVFARHRIDYCCGGALTLEEACERVGADVRVVADEITQEIARDAEVPSVEGLDAGQLIDLLLTNYHEPLRQELARLDGMAQKVWRVHAEVDGERLRNLAVAVAELQDDLLPHMHKEEQVLFPMIEAGHGTMAVGPISVMQRDHDTTGGILRRIRELTNDFKVPGDACMTWRALWTSLERLEQAIHEHIHIENNVLFPKALHGE
jgi:regulator of cell morphogenesis and NO signaling